MKRLSIAVAIGFLATTACGGSTFTYDTDAAPPRDGGVDSPSPPPPPPPPPFDGGHPDAGPSDGGGPWSPKCPAQAPSVGAKCTSEGLECEYGDAWWSISCDVVVRCMSGAWQNYTPSYQPCTPKPGPNPGECPGTYQSVSQGSSCSATGTSCYYPEGMCTCQVPLGGPILPDSGMHGYWGCDPGAGCPYPRARVGSACTQEGQSCMYDECSYGQSCTGGVWQTELIACAGGAH